MQNTDEMKIKTGAIWGTRVQVSCGVVETEEKKSLGEGLSKVKCVQRSYLKIYDVVIQVKIIIQEDRRMHELWKKNKEDMRNLGFKSVWVEEHGDIGE